MTRRRPSPALLVALLALFVALGGPAEAKKLLVRAKDIKEGAVATKQVRDRSIQVADLTRGAVDRLQATPTSSVGEFQLLDGAVTAPKLAAGAVTTGALGPGAVTGLNIAPNTIGLANLGDSSVGGGKIRNGAVHKEDIAQQAVGQQELAGTRGTGTFPVPEAQTPLAPGECLPGIDVTVTPAPAAEDTVGVLDDLVLGGRTAGWPTTLALRVQPTTPGVVTGYACNTGADAIDVTAALSFTVLTIAA